MDEIEYNERKKFWKSFGFYEKKVGKRMSGGRYHDHVWENEIDDIRWISPDGYDYGHNPPKISLETLFNCVVPRAIRILEEDYGWECIREFFKRFIHKMGEQTDHIEHVDFTLALYEVIKEIKDEQGKSNQENSKEV